MKVKELKRLLSYFSDEIDVVICWKTDKVQNIAHISDVIGKPDGVGHFYVSLIEEEKEE